MDPLQKRIAREGEQEFATILRNRSGQDAGRIDMAVRVESVSQLGDDDQSEIVDTAFCLLETVLSNVKPEAKAGKRWWLDRIASQFNPGAP